MAAYHNCYTMLGDVLKGLNDYSTARHNATSTSGPFDNDWIVNQINRAQRHLYNLLIMRIPEQFLTSTTLTITSSVGTLPWDFGRLVELKDADGLKCFPSGIQVLPPTGSDGDKRLYYRKGNTIVLNKSGVSASYTLWYRTKPRDLNQGVAGATNNYLASSAKLIDDYYNGMTIENITGGWYGTITDYTGSTRLIVCSAGTLTATTHYYGIVSELPEAFHHLITPMAVIFCKMEHPRTQEKGSRYGASDLVNAYKLWTEEVADTLRAFAGSAEDISIEEIFSDYSTAEEGYGGVSFPGHGIIY